MFPTRREFFGNRAQDAQESGRSDIARTLNAIPFLKGRLISVKLAAATDLYLSHGLGAPAAFFVIRQNYDGTATAAIVVESASSVQAKLDQNRQIGVVASAACTVDLWVYPRASAQIDLTTGQSK